ncbi:MAG: hypothetical protein IE919_19790, partial [Thioclava sp.]
MSAPTVVAVVSEELFTEFFSDADAERLRAVAAGLGGGFARVDRLAEAELGAARVVITSWGVGPFDAAIFVGLEEAAGREREPAVRRPGRAGEAGHEEDEVGVDVAALGIHTLFRKAERLVAEVGVDAALRHFGQQTGDGFFAQTFAGLGGGIEEREFD